MNTNTNTATATLTGLAGARAMVDCLAETVGKVMAGKGVDLETATRWVLEETARTSPETMARLLRSLERTRRAEAAA